MITVFGRIDHQVKVRGQRIELGEIEAILTQHPAVNLAAVVVVKPADDNVDGRIVAHVVPHEGASVVAASVRSFCHDRLPEYMVPAFVAVHDALPYTPTGKVDRNTLANLGLPAATEVPSVTVEQLVGSDPRLAKMVGLWSDILGAPVGPDENFFHAGGHSILGVELLVRIRQEFGRRLPLGSLVTAGTPRLMLAATDAEVSDQRCLQVLRPGVGPATVIVHGGGGYLLRLYALAQRVTPGRPVFGLQAFGLHPGESVDQSVAEISRRYLGSWPWTGFSTMHSA